MKPVRARAAGDGDVEAAIDFYLTEAGADVADRFAAAVETAYRTVGERPGAGSPRYGQHVHIEGLRTRKVGRFPHLIFYIERERHIEILRVLHAQRDIPAALSDVSG